MRALPYTAAGISTLISYSKLNPLEPYTCPSPKAKNLNLSQTPNPCTPNLPNLHSGARRKCVASCVLRTGSMSTSFTTTLMSEPEKPSVRRPSASKSGCVSALGVSPRWILNICVRAAASGSGMYTRCAQSQKTGFKWKDFQGFWEETLKTLKTGFDRRIMAQPLHVHAHSSGRAMAPSTRMHAGQSNRRTSMYDDRATATHEQRM